MAANGGLAMKRSSWIVIALILAIAVALAVFKDASKLRLSDEDQIHALLVKGQTAIRHKDLKAAMSCVSTRYSDRSGSKYEALRVQAIQAFQQEGNYDCLLENTTISLDRDAASVQTTVTISLASGTSLHTVFSEPITIHLKKERSRRWLILPVESWKIIGIDGLTVESAE
jgi:hypothetical protein